MPFTVKQEICPKCDKPVYHAEKRCGPNGKQWHEKCFCCSECRKKLDSTSLNNKDDILYCKTCYGKEHGPKGYGYGSGAGALTNTGKSK